MTHGFEHLHVDYGNPWDMLTPMSPKTVTTVKPNGAISSLGTVSAGLMPVVHRSSGRVRDAAGRWEKKVKEQKKRKYRSIDDPWEPQDGDQGL